MNIKVCGITQPSEVHLLDELEIPFGGVWCRIPGGDHNLSDGDFEMLTKITTKSLNFIWVTFESSLQTITNIIRRTQVKGIQLHGFQLPSLVKGIKTRFGKTVKVFKVLHIHKSNCLEENLIQRYEAAGVDFFIADTYLSAAQPGSTGISLPPDALKRLIQGRLNSSSIFIAGGVNEKTIPDLMNCFQPFGIDIDSYSRLNGLISRNRIISIQKCIGELNDSKRKIIQSDHLQCH